MVRKAIIFTILSIVLFAPAAFSAPPPETDSQSYIKLSVNSAKYIDKDNLRCILIDLTIENATSLYVSGTIPDFKLRDMDNGYAYKPGMSCPLPGEVKYDLWNMDKIEPHTKGRGIVSFELPKGRLGNLKLYFNGKVTDLANKLTNPISVAHSVTPVDYNEPAKSQPLQAPQPVQGSSLPPDKAKASKNKDTVIVSRREDATIINIEGSKTPVNEEKEAVVKLSDMQAQKEEKTDKDSHRTEALEKKLDKLATEFENRIEAEKEKQEKIRQIGNKDFEVTGLIMEKASPYRYKISGDIRNTTEFFFDYVKFRVFLQSGLNEILKESSFAFTIFAPGEKKHFEEAVRYDSPVSAEKCSVELGYFIIRN